MDRRSHKVSSLSSRLHSCPGGTVWLYDTSREEFLEEPGILEEPWPEVEFRLPPQRRWRKPPATRSGRLLYWLFIKGGMSVVFVLALMTFALVGALIGFR